MTPTPRRGTRRPLAAGTALAVGLTLLAGCTSDPLPTGYRDTKVPTGALRLVAFTSCDDALGRLKQAAKEYVGPYGFGGEVGLFGDRRAAAAAPGMAEDAKSSTGGAAPGSGAQPNYSGTNTHEAGVDEPDLVKTDGRRIVTVNQGLLRIVDAATRKQTAQWDLRTNREDPVQWSGADLLMQGDRLLVMIRQEYFGGLADGPRMPPAGKVAGPRLLLVDLAGTPRVLSEYRIDGSLVDARQVGGTARVVVRSAPRLTFPYRENRTDAQRTADNKRIIDKADADAWLPRYEVTTAGRTTSGQVGCERISRPATYSGASMVSVLSFDLGKSALGDGDPVTVVADGDTVYSNGPSLYVANDQRWKIIPEGSPGRRRSSPPDQVTELYKFDTSQPGRPRYVAAGSVKGWLINQYALSEWEGNLRVATTTGQIWAAAADANAQMSSTVYVLGQKGDALAEQGKVTGLGKGERIYAVRFAGPVGYVVTFRQVDPLYTVDLSRPTKPRVTGELKITGYSAYLHPVGDGRLIGVGQEASTQGQRRGTQVSLFDVSNLDRPGRLAQHFVREGNSDAESDPHAFLYWPADRLLVLPISVYDSAVIQDSPDAKATPSTGAMVLRVTDSGFTELGMVTHATAADGKRGPQGVIRRSLVIDGVLWTLSEAGLKATNMSTLDSLAWLPW